MADFQRINIADAQNLMTNQPVALVDIRDEQSFERAHIANAIHLDNGNLQEFIAATDFETPVIVCCYHGHSSMSAAQFLADQGFSTVYSLDGGFEQWRIQCPFVSDELKG